MKMPPSQRSKRQDRIRSWVLANRLASIADTMKATGASQATVSRIRKELIQAGLVEKFAHTPATMRDPDDTNAPPQVPGLSTDELLTQEAEAVIEGLVPMDRDYRRRKLEALVAHGAADHVIRASKALEDMEQRDAIREDVGPTPPQSLEEGIDEATDIVEALADWGGEEAVKTAVVRGLARFKEEQKRRAKPDEQSQPIFEEA